MKEFVTLVLVVFCALGRACPTQAFEGHENGVALGEPGVAKPQFAPQSITPIPAVQTMMGQVTTATLLNIDGGLSGEWPVVVGGSAYTITSRNTASGEPITKATQYVYEWMQANGLAAQYLPWTKSGYTNRNVVGQLTGLAHPNDVYLITAHLDNMPYGAVAYGADDNASGSTAVLLAAQIMSQYQWNCTLRFALWTGEEQGLLGSSVYAANARAQNETILGVVNLDMISWNAVAPNTVDLYSRSDVSGSMQIAQVYSDVIGAYGLNLAPNQLVDNWLGYYSDNASFWAQSYPAMLAIENYSGDFNPYYHTTNDRVGYVDLNYFAANVKAAIGTLAHLSGCLIGPAPTSTPTPTPTATQTPTPTATATSTPTPTSTPILHWYWLPNTIKERAETW